VHGSRKPRRPRPPLDHSALSELALAYVGRFATTRAKLRAYLQRKVRERGWSGTHEPDLDAIAARLAEQGYVDDAGYALSKAQSLTARGFGKRRVLDTLRTAGVDESDGEDARDHADHQALAAALRFAERRRIGPYAAVAPGDPKAREKVIAAMVRAGHAFDTARAIAGLAPGAPVDVGELAERLRLTAP
jgi:regulatory protein